MTKPLTYLVILYCCICLSPAVWGQCGYKATVKTSNNYCVGSSLIARSTHALQNIVWYRNGQPVSTVTGTQSLDTIPLVISLPKDSGYNAITRLCTDGAGNVYALNSGAAQIEIYSPGGATTVLNTSSIAPWASDMFVDPSGNIYLLRNGSNQFFEDSDFVLKLVAGAYDTATWIPGTAINVNQYGFAASMFIDCRGDTYIYTAEQRVVKWTPGSTTGVLVAGANNGDTICQPPGGSGQVWVDNAGAIFFMVGTGIQKLAPGASQATTVISGACDVGATIWVSDFFLDGKDTLYLAGMNVGAKTVVLQKLAPGSSTPATIATLPLNMFTGDFSTFTMDIRGNFYLSDLADTKLFELRRTSAIDSAFKPTDTGSYYAVVTDIQGYSTVTDTIVINSPVTAAPSISITATEDSTPVCTPVTFTAAVNNPGSGAGYQWMVSGVPVGSDSTTYSNNLFADGDQVYCILTAPDGCAGPVADTSNKIRMGINPEGAASVTIAASPKRSICTGQTIAFTATVMNGSANPAFEWLVNGDSTGDDSSSFTRSNFSNNDVVTCLITSDDVCGLAKSNSIPLIVSIPPVIEPGQIFTIPRGGNLTLDPVVSGSVDTWAWSPGSWLSDSTIADPVADPPASVTYTLMVAANGGCGDTATILVDVFTPLAIPNAFSPNGDGRNDRFYVLGGPINSVVETFDVFNRWGQPVFMAHNTAPGDAAAGWDGRVNGSPAPSGTYVYVVVMRFATESRQMYKGTVEVIR
ncbi:MAG TPA: gliding motility-associated C-terminal domain-containing protein [Puia sp.]|nr:gliding motility-associated C-terminal domain-containing protein [Puia sp.]